MSEPIICPFSGRECDLERCPVAVQLRHDQRVCGVKEIVIAGDAIHADLDTMNQNFEKLAEALTKNTGSLADSTERIIQELGQLTATSAESIERSTDKLEYMAGTMTKNIEEKFTGDVEEENHGGPEE